RLSQDLPQHAEQLAAGVGQIAVRRPGRVPPRLIDQADELIAQANSPAASMPSPAREMDNLSRWAGRMGIRPASTPVRPVRRQTGSEVQPNPPQGPLARPWFPIDTTGLGPEGQPSEDQGRATEGPAEANQYALRGDALWQGGSSGRRRAREAARAYD